MNRWDAVVNLRNVVSLASVAFHVGVPIAVWGRSHSSRGARTFAWWLALGGATSVTGFAMALTGTHNIKLGLAYQLCSALLMSLTGYRLLSGPRQRRLVVVCAAVYALFWLVMIVSGIEARDWLSSYTNPGEQIVLLLVGILLVAESIRISDQSPLQHAEAWIGLGLVIAAGTGVAISPIIAEMARHSVAKAAVLRQITQGFTLIALILWCIPYWKRGVTWTR